MVAEALLSERIAIASVNAPGVVPRSYAPPGYVFPEEGDYNNTVGYLENGNQRCVRGRMRERAQAGLTGCRQVLSPWVLVGEWEAVTFEVFVLLSSVLSSIYELYCDCTLLSCTPLHDQT